MRAQDLIPFFLADLMDEVGKNTGKAITEALHLMRGESIQADRLKTVRTIGNVIYTTPETFL
jgi:hypothetical protein